MSKKLTPRILRALAPSAAAAAPQAAAPPQPDASAPASVARAPSAAKAGVSFGAPAASGEGGAPSSSGGGGGSHAPSRAAVAEHRPSFNPSPRVTVQGAPAPAQRMPSNPALQA